ncbi:17945_t:CDS:2 [Cetraspora pellucida]|uniref:17945_t:CDS:1 n=1 Tax=Cetraspora pellucida TaxID=1433469 RepID=A0ACA9MYZ7_9GLOM|nr:17945_t:CDS:2 [Cetraspora pellucida]
MEKFIKENLTQLEKTIEDNYKHGSNLSDKEVESYFEKAEQVARNQKTSRRIQSNGTMGTITKYKELLESLLEKQEQMFDDKNLNKRLKNDQQLIRGKPQPEIFLLEDASKTNSTTSLLQIPSKLKNEVNPEEDKEFKLQNPPTSRLKRQISIVLTALNQSSNTYK